MGFRFLGFLGVFRGFGGSNLRTQNPKTPKLINPLRALGFGSSVLRLGGLRGIYGFVI